MREKSGLNYDEVLEYIGQFGTFQRRIAFLLCFVALATGIAVVVFAFAGESKKCCVPVTIVSICHGHQASSLPTDAMFLSVKTKTAHTLKQLMESLTNFQVSIERIKLNYPTDVKS